MAKRDSRGRARRCDCDVLRPRVPEELRQAAREFAAEVCRSGEILGDDWLRDDPSALVQDLPKGWEERLQAGLREEAVTLRALGRLDLLRSKPFALCDRAINLSDCLALRPSKAYLWQVLPWLEERDANSA